jgi:Phage portal protein
MHIPAPTRPATVKAGPVGPGAGVLMTEYLLPTILGTEPRQRMAKAIKMGNEIDWVRGAERTISGKVSGAKWHLEDPDGETMDDDWLDNGGNAIAYQACSLLEQPQAELPLLGPDGVGRRQTRRQQMGITSRHMGLAGNAAWYLDLLDGNGLPHAILYVRPDRLEPKCSDTGVLEGWELDKRPGRDGTPLPLEQVQMFQFSLPDEGIWAAGLIETCMAKAINSGLVDRHYTALLSSGGRLSGLLMPKEGRIDDNGVYNQLVRDWRNITEQPEAARRAQIVRMPMDFTPTVQSVGEMQIIDLIYHNRDALLALWGVPLSMLGGTTSSGGLNSGETRKYDEASLWQGAVHDRLQEFVETIQNGILNRWEAVVGWAPKLIFDEPSFDDDEPNYKKGQLALTMPLRNVERRALVGLDPFGDPLLDNQVILPATMAEFAIAPDEDGNIPEQEKEDEEPPPPQPIFIPMPNGPAPVDGQPPTGAPPVPIASGQPATGKAQLHPVPVARDVGAARLRDRMAKAVTPHLKSAVHDVLQDQRHEVSRMIEKNWEQIKVHGVADETLWWPDAKKQDAALRKALDPALSGMAEVVHDHIAEALGDTPPVQ